MPQRGRGGPRYTELEVKLQRPTNRPRGRVLDRNLFALFRDLVNAVRYVGDVELEIQLAGLRTPRRQPRRQVASKVLRQARAVFHDRSAAVAERRSAPEPAPAVVIEKL